MRRIRSAAQRLRPCSTTPATATLRRIQALRSIRRSPLLAAGIVGLLAIGIGAAATAFALINTVVLRPLPYSSPEQLVVITGEIASHPEAMDGISPPDFLDFQRQVSTLRRLAAEPFGATPSSMETPNGAAPITIAPVSASYFDVLGVPAAHGRTFRPADPPPDLSGPIVISSRAARLAFGDDTAAVGRVLKVSARSHQVIGVMPPSFRSPVDADIWLVVDFRGPAFVERGIEARSLRMIGRLGPDTRVADARIDLETISRRLQLKYPATNEGFIARPAALSDTVVGRVRNSLWTLLAGASLLWLIGAVNGSFLFAANVARRRQDLAIRAALGAGFRSLEGQIFVESLVLSAIGGIVALWLARTSLRILQTLPGLQLPRIENANVDRAVLMALGIMTLVSALFVGLGAAAFGVPRHLAPLLRQGSATPDARLSRWRRWLIFAQVALGSALLVLALQSGRTYLEIRSTPPGFDVSNLLTFDLALPQVTYPTDASLRTFADNLVQTMHTVPGIRYAAVANLLPLVRDDNVSSFAIEGRPDDPRDPPVAAQHIVSREYFDALRIPVVAGRSFSDIETRPNAPLAVVVSERLAERYFPGVNAVGRALVVDVGEKKRAAIVGVTGSVRFTGLDRPPAVEMFLAADQFPLGVMSVVVRTDTAPGMLTTSVADAVHRLDRGLALSLLQPMDARLAASVGRPRVQALALGAFAAVALLLAFAGVFALIRYDIACRRREIVTRVALGATPHAITLALVGQSLQLGVLGVGGGLALAALLSRLTASQIYGVSATSPSLLALSGTAMCGVVAIASFTAARRVSRLQASEALRQL